MFRRLIFAAILLLLLTPSIANACSCMSSNAPCNQMWKSGELIFLGTAIDRNPAEPPAREGDSIILSRRLAYRFSVTESFRGPAIPGGEIVIYTGSGGGDCSYPFKVGTSYLVYASTYKDELTTGICVPNSPKVMVGAVLHQLRALQKGQRVDDLFGTIGKAPEGVGHVDLVETQPLADIRVRVIGSRGAERSTTTDREGVYSFRSLPPDTYRLEVDLPSGMSTWQRNRGDTITVQIGAKGTSGCRADQFARPDGRISGWVVDETGKGVAGFVTIQPADPKEAESASRRGGLPGYTTDDGSFTLPLLSPGRYRLSFHPKIDGKVNLGVPPAWSDIIDLAFGQQIENFLFKVSRSIWQ